MQIIAWMLFTNLVLFHSVPPASEHMIILCLQASLCFVVAQRQSYSLCEWVVGALKSSDTEGSLCHYRYILYTKIIWSPISLVGTADGVTHDDTIVWHLPWRPNLRRLTRGQTDCRKSGKWRNGLRLPKPRKGQLLQLKISILHEIPRCQRQPGSQKLKARVHTRRLAASDMNIEQLKWDIFHRKAFQDPAEGSERVYNSNLNFTYALAPVTTATGPDGMFQLD